MVYIRALYIGKLSLTLLCNARIIITNIGSQNFQLSEKLFTRYSAVAVQPGCPFIERLNDV